jgi:general stress protein YciG
VKGVFNGATPERHREIAALGGRAAHAKGKARKFDSTTGKLAGQRGGAKTAQNREHMRKIGKAGAAARQAKK